MGKRHKSFADLKAATLQANPNKKKKPFARQRLEERGIPLEGVSPVIRQDRVSRRASGGRDKQKGLGGLGHLLIIGLPHPGMMDTPEDTRRAAHLAKHRHEIKTSPHAASGGGHARGGAVSDGHTLRDLRRKTQP